MLSRRLIRRGESESSSITRPWGGGAAKTIYKKMASKTVTVLLALAASVGARAARLETKEEMIAFLSAHPSRAYFSRLIRDGPYDVAMEVGVADGRFSEHFLLDAQPKTW